MGRLPKKPSLYARCEELGIEYNEKMSIKELEDLISKNTKRRGRPRKNVDVEKIENATVTITTTKVGEKKNKRGRRSKRDSLIKKYMEVFPGTAESRFASMSDQDIENAIKEQEESLMTPYDYFQSVKDAVKEIDKEDITKMYEAASNLMEKYKETGQEKAEKRLAFHVKTLLKESKLIDKGITKFVQKDDITNYIDHVSKKPVKIIEMKNYPREIPDELISVIKDTKNIFDEFYIVFTDYSEGELVKEVEKDRDPILFGGFCTSNREIVAERFYYLGDWEDEYCDLTLDKLIKETSKDIVKEVSIPTNRDELICQLEAYEEKKNGDGTHLYYNTPKKPPFFKRVFNAIFGRDE